MALTTPLLSDSEEWGHEGSDLGLSEEDELASTCSDEIGSVDIVSGHIGDEDHQDGICSDKDSDTLEKEDEEDEIMLCPELQNIKGMTYCQ